MYEALQIGEGTKLIKEHNSYGERGNVAKREDEKFEVGCTNLSAVGKFIAIELSVEHPACKDGNKHSAYREKHHAWEVVEHREDVAVKYGDSAERSEGERTKRA